MQEAFDTWDPLFQSALHFLIGQPLHCSECQVLPLVWHSTRNHTQLQMMWTALSSAPAYPGHGLCRYQQSHVNFGTYIA